MCGTECDDRWRFRSHFVTFVCVFYPYSYRMTNILTGVLTHTFEICCEQDNKVDELVRVHRIRFVTAQKQTRRKGRRTRQHGCGSQLIFYLGSSHKRVGTEAQKTQTCAGHIVPFYDVIIRTDINIQIISREE